MAYAPIPSDKMQQWATMIQDRGLVNFAIPLLDVLQVWGFVGGQILWMAAPFLGEHTLAPIAEALEQPETIRQFQRYLLEGEAK